jgi:hypothetical protein
MTSGDELVKKLVEMAESRHGQHVAKIHSTWSRAIGLSSRRLARRTRYAPNDRLLKTLVVAIVDDRMQFDDFLAEAQRRYGLVIGDAEGKRLVSQKKVDQEALSENRGAAMRRKSFRRESRKSLTVSPLAAMAHLSTRWLRPSAWMRWLMPYTNSEAAGKGHASPRSMQRHHQSVRQQLQGISADPPRTPPGQRTAQHCEARSEELRLRRRIPWLRGRPAAPCSRPPADALRQKQ